MVARDGGNVVISLSDKRLLSMDEFAIYTSMGMNRTSELSGALLSGPTDGNPLYVCQYRAAENHIGRMKGICRGS